MSKREKSEYLAYAKIPTYWVAILTWFVTVVFFSALALIGPVVVPGKHFHWDTSFGKGELLGFALGLFAASLGRWIVHDGPRLSVHNKALAILSWIGLATSASGIAILWNDAYRVEVGQEKTLHYGTSIVVEWSIGLVIASVVIGVLTEVCYVRLLKKSKRTLRVA
jgi:hypothetical protein